MLYHSEFGIPASVRAQTEGTYCLGYSQHARAAAQSDRYGPLHFLPRTIWGKEATLIEVETGDDGVVIKMVFRLNYDARRDIVLAIKPNGFVKTVWANLKSDNHATLRKGHYASLHQ